MTKYQGALFITVIYLFVMIAYMEAGNG